MKKGIYCWLYAALVGICLSGCQQAINHAPKAEKGVLDLGQWDFDRGGVIKLKGDWEFYWQQFLYQQDFSGRTPPDMTGHLMSPGIWRFQEFGDLELPRHGFATLRLKVHLPRDDQKLVMEIKDIRTAYEVEINGELVASCGAIGKTEDTSQPQFVVKRPIIPSDTSELNIVVRLSEFHRDSGGIPVPIALGTNSQILSRARNSIIEEWLLIGFLLFSAIYHFGLVFLRSRDLANLYFGVFCVNFILRLLTRGEKILFELTPLSWWWVMNKLELIILYLIPILYLIYYNELFKNRLKKKVYWFMICLFGILLSIVIFGPGNFITNTLLIFQVSGLLSTIYIMWVTFRAYTEKVEHSGVFLVGFVVLIIGITNDIMYFSFIYRTIEVFNYSCIIFIFTQAYELADRSVKAFNREEELSKSLDNKVSQRTEQLSKANVIKGKLLSIVSHDLRGPLTSLHGLLKLIDKEQIDKKEGKRLLNGIRQSLDSSLTLLDNILLWASSQLKSNTVQVAIERLELSALIQESILPFAHQASQKNITITSEIPEGVYVMGDKNMLKSVLRNLISNGIKFTLIDGFIRLSFSRENGQIVIFITDSGIGLPEDLKGKLFDIGMVKSRLGTSDERGAGVGLILCEDLIRQMDGKIWENSDPGQKGSTFSFSLPAG